MPLEHRSQASVYTNKTWPGPYCKLNAAETLTEIGN